MNPHPVARIPSRFERNLPAGDARIQEFTSDCSSLLLEVSIRADIRRLFHALTVPEYLEAWISFPGDHFGCSTIASRNNEDFLIEHSCEGKREFSIAGTYSVCRRHNLSFSWRVDGNLRMPKTEIDIRLHGDFENTRLVLQQSGFASPSDWRGTGRCGQPRSEGSSPYMTRRRSGRRQILAWDCCNQRSRANAGRLKARNINVSEMNGALVSA